MSEPTRYTYTEDDWIAEVEIVEDHSTLHSQDYTLKVIRTIRPTRMYQPVADGTVFHCEQVRSYGRVFRLAPGVEV